MQKRNSEKILLFLIHRSASFRKMRNAILVLVNKYQAILWQNKLMMRPPYFHDLQNFDHIRNILINIPVNIDSIIIKIFLLHENMLLPCLFACSSYGLAFFIDLLKMNQM